MRGTDSVILSKCLFEKQEEKLQTKSEYHGYMRLNCWMELKVVSPHKKLEIFL